MNNEIRKSRDREFILRKVIKITKSHFFQKDQAEEDINKAHNLHCQVHLDLDSSSPPQWVGL